ncbi:MAG: FtsX-like permease family protein [Actinomycetota bacterium]|nr:FtsX-like permease family protein [Actinomycetota bacterium]
MNAVIVRLRTELRSGWRAWLGLTLLLAIAAGAAVTAAAGARRTETAYPRFLKAQDAFDAATGGGAEENFSERLKDVRAMPEVEDSIEEYIVGGALTLPAMRGHPERTVSFPNMFVTADPSGRAYYQTNRAKVVEGRLADRTRADEAMVPFTVADRLDIRIGDTLLAGIGFDEQTFGPREQVKVRIVGIEAAPGEFEGVGQTSFLSMYVTPALYNKYKPIIPQENPDLSNVAIHLRGGPQASYAFKSKVERVYNIDVPEIQPVNTNGVQKTMRLYAIAFWLLGALITIATIAIFGQTLGRQILIESNEYPALRALGFGRRQLVMLGILRASVIGLAALPLAAAIAYLGSALTPIGTARIAEPHPGFAFDGLAIGAGVGITLIMVLLLALPPSIRAARLARIPSGATLPGSERPSRVVELASRSSGSAAAVTGLRMALEPGRGRTAVPVRTTILAVAIGVVAVTSTLVAAQSLHYLINTPSLAGFTYDAIVPTEEGDPAQNAKKIKEYDFVEAVSPGTGLNITVGGIDSFLIGFEQGGPIRFATIAGRAPTDALNERLPEIALGPATLRRMKLHIGGIVEMKYLTGEDNQQVGAAARARIVGTAAIPALPWAATPPGEGGVMTIGGIHRFSPNEGGCCYVRFKPHTDLVGAQTTLSKGGLQTFIRTDRADLVTLEHVTAIPTALSLIFTVMAIAAMAHVLVTGIRRRRRDFAILKTLGFLKHQVRSAIAWQASTITVVCLAVGVPGGIALGRWSWRSIADQFGVVPLPKIPFVLLVAIVPAAVLAANLIALMPGRSAAGTEPAVILRTE